MWQVQTGTPELPNCGGLVTKRGKQGRRSLVSPGLCITLRGGMLLENCLRKCLCLSWFDRLSEQRSWKGIVSELLCHLPVGWKVQDLAGGQLGWCPSRPLWLPGWTQFCLPHLVPSYKDTNHIGLRSKSSNHFHLITPWGPFIWESQFWGTRGLGLQLVNLGQGVFSSQQSLRRLYLQ